MVTQELINYVKDAISKGQSIDMIKSSLVQGGWSSADIDEAARAINPVIASSPQFSPPVQSIQPSRSPILKILVVILVLGALGFSGWWLYTYKVKDGGAVVAVVSEELENNPLPIVPPENVMDSENVEVALADILNVVKAGKSYHCSYSDSVTDKEIATQITTTFYMAKGKFFGEYNMSVQGKGFNVKHFFIADNEYVYSWSSLDGTPYESIKSETGNYDLEQRLTSMTTSKDPYTSCVSWVADMSKFTPPPSLPFPLGDR